MTEHSHREFDDTCFRCHLSRDESFALKGKDMWDVAKFAVCTLIIVIAVLVLAKHGVF